MLTENQKQCKHEWNRTSCNICFVWKNYYTIYHQGLNDRALEAVKLLTDESMHTIGSVRHKMVWHCIDLLKSKFGVE